MKFLSILFLRSNPIDPDPRVEKEARALAEAGYTVAVLGWDRTAALPSREEKNGVVIHRLGIKAEFGKGLANFPALLRWQVSLFWWLLRHQRQVDVIHSCDFDTILPALALKWLAKKRVVYDIFDFYADHLRATPALIKQLIRCVDLFAVDKADAVILPDESRQAQIASANPRSVTYIYNSPEEPADLPALPRTSSFLFNITYVGLLQVERGLLTLLEVLEKHPQWGLWLAGFGGDQEVILQKALTLPNVTFYGRVPYNQALSLSQMADVLVATYDPSIPNHRFSSPNKIFEAMMLSKPIVVARHTNMDDIVARADCGIVVEYGSVTELEIALSELAENVELRHRLGANGRKAYLSTYRWEIMAKRLFSLYSSLSGV